MSSSRYVVAKASDVPLGSRLMVNVAGREVAIFNVGGRFYAMLNRCPHLGGPLCKGEVVTGITASEPGKIEGDMSKAFVTCPWHNWEFDITTGQSYWNDRLRARNFAVSIESGEQVLRNLKAEDQDRTPGPYKAETIPVVIENDYIVLNVNARTRSAVAS